jgi:hypothetical protein
MQFSSLPINSSLQNNPRYQFSLKLENIEILPILSAAILDMGVAWGLLCLTQTQSNLVIIIKAPKEAWRLIVFAPFLITIIIIVIIIIIIIFH